MHETAGGVHVLADMAEPKTSRVSLEPIEYTVAEDFDRPDPIDGNRQQQIVGTLGHVACELPLFTQIARQEIELRPTDDADILRIPRRGGLAEAQPCSVAAGFRNG